MSYISSLTYMQDVGDFNVATSSLHALSNCMTAIGQTGESNSPHTSPRFLRRNTAQQLMAVQNELYAFGTITTLSIAGFVTTENVSAPTVPNVSAASISEDKDTATTACQALSNEISAPLFSAARTPDEQLIYSNDNGNKNGILTKKSSVHFEQSSTATVSVSISNDKDLSITHSDWSEWRETMNQEPAVIDSSKISPMNSLSAKFVTESDQYVRQSHDLSGNYVEKILQAPPLPPRKPSLGVSECTVQQNIGISSVMNKIYGLTGSKTEENAATEKVGSLNEDLCVPSTVDSVSTIVSTITKRSMDLMTEDMRQLGVTAPSCTKPVRSLLDEDIEVGPAETIMGVIDTRPLEARHITPRHSRQSQNTGYLDGTEIHLMDYVATAPHYIHISTTSQSSPLSMISNHLSYKGSEIYEDKRQQLHLLPHQHLQQYYQHLHQLQQDQSGTIQQQHAQSIQNTQFRPNQQRLQLKRTQNPSLYENVMINPKSYSNVPYENINLEHITLLMREGYTKDNVISALVISRNNIEMACEILREFVTKNST